MYNAKAVILGILVFAVLFSTPFWANFGGTKDYKRPAIVLPQNEKECVEPVEFMRAEHMYLLTNGAIRPCAMRTAPMCRPPAKSGPSACRTPA